MNMTKPYLIAKAVGALVLLAPLARAKGDGINDLIGGLLRSRTTSVSTRIINSGRSVTNLDGFAGSETHFRLLVPEGQTQLKIRTSGGQGDVDVYVQFSATATRSFYTSRSTGWNNNEYISIANPRAGWWHVMLRGSSNYSNVSLTAEFLPGEQAAQPPVVHRPPPTVVFDLPPGVTRLVAGRDITDLAGKVGDRLYFQVLVPPKAESLSVGTAGGSGDSDLYVSRGVLPDAKKYEAVSNGNGTGEKITINNPAPGAWYVLVYGYKPFEGVTVGANVTGGVVRRPIGGQLDIVAPAPGTDLRAGGSYMVQWHTRELAGRVRVLQSFDEGHTWSDIIPASVADIRIGKLKWTVPFALRGRGRTVRLRIIGMDNSQLLADAGPYAIVRRHPLQPRPGPAIDPEAARLGRYVDAFETDSQQKPAEIVANVKQRHTIYGRGDNDWMVFRPPAPGQYRVTFSDVQVKLEAIAFAGRPGDGRLSVIKKFDVITTGYAMDLTVDRNVAFVMIYAEADHKEEVGGYSVLIQQIQPPRPGRRPSPRGPETPSRDKPDKHR